MREIISLIIVINDENVVSVVFDQLNFRLIYIL